MKKHLRQQDGIYDRIRKIIEIARGNIVHAVNAEMVIAYWHIGKEIIDEEQRGKSRADYGEHLLNKLSEKLQSVYHYSKEKADKESETFESNCSKEAGSDTASKVHAKQNEKTQDSTHLASHSNSPPMKKTSDADAQHSSVTHSKDAPSANKNESLPKKGFPIKTIKKVS